MKKTVKRFGLIIIVMSLVSCGDLPLEEEEGVLQQEQEQEMTTSSSSSVVSGYITPLSISVDGKQYMDSEDFYTKEINRLRVEVKEQYPDYELTFEADLGLRNFKSGMYVFLAASGDVGIASESYVNATGKFSFNIDETVDLKLLYTLRATKRIGLKLVGKDKDIKEEVIHWCYNMFAQKEIALENNPVVLRDFFTTVTEYQCQEGSDGIQLPSNDLQTPMDYIWKEANDRELKRMEELNKKIEEKNKPVIAEEEEEEEVQD